MSTQKKIQTKKICEINSFINIFKKVVIPPSLLTVCMNYYSIVEKRKANP